MNLDEMLGIDPATPIDRRAKKLVEADRGLLEDLIARRKQLGLSQKEVGRRMDIDQSAVARIESGVRDLHQSTLRRYAMAVEVVIEHRVVADDPAHQKSASIIDGLRDQINKGEPLTWANATLYELSTGLSSWRKSASKSCQPANG